MPYSFPQVVPAFVEVQKVTEEPSLVSRDSLETAAHWIIVVAGLVYGTGFLTVFTFLSRFGITEAGSELFKAKYIFVGILYLLLPAIVGVPVVATLYLRREGTGTGREPRVYLPSVILTVNLLLVFYVYVLFAPRRFLEHKEFVVPVLFTLTFGGIAVVRWFEKPVGKLLKMLANATHPGSSALAEKWEQKVLDDYGKYSRWALCVVIAPVVDVYALWGLFRLLGRILWDGSGSGGYVLLLLVMLMGYLVNRTIIRCKEIRNKGMRIAVWAVTSCLVGALYYFSVLIFAVRVYPYVPAVRGGGDYTESPRVLLRFKADSAGSLPVGTLGASAGNGLTSRDLMILEVTSTSVFVADPAEGGGPEMWRGPERPLLKIIEIRRDDVETISYSR